MKKLIQIVFLYLLFLSSSYDLNSQTLWATGDNGQGEFGNGTGGNLSSNWIMIGTDTTWKQVSCGYQFTIALKQNGTLWASGNGALGIGTNYGKTSFTQIGNDSDWKAMKCGSSFAIAQKQDGSLWTWGQNIWGSLGDGTYIDKNKPVKIGVDNDWKDFDCGDYFVLAIKQDGSLWSWGGGSYGQLGDGTNKNRNTPLRIDTDNDWKSIACGLVHSLALKQDGSIWAWGSNDAGELGDGTKIRRNKPLRVGIETDWLKVFGAVWATYAIKKDGSLWAWGGNYVSTLGDGTNIDRLSPARLGLDNDWQTLASGWDEIKHNLAIKKDSTLWGWGDNSGGQLGDGKANFRNPLYYTSPTFISNEKNWLSLACGWDFSIALRSTSAPAINSSAMLSDTAFILKDRACIPLTLHFNKITPSQQKKGTFTITLAYNSLALQYLEGLDTSKYKFTISTQNNKQSLTITSDTIIFTGKDTISLNLCFNTYLADSLKNVISITNFDFTGENNVITRDGTIEFLGCKIDLRKVDINPITFEMSPNSVQDKLIINFKGFENTEPITIMNIVGATLLETTIKESIDVSSLSSGLYFLKIRNQVYKFVKE